MEEIREQPIIMPAQALNGAENIDAMSEVGSQNQEGELGKFKSVKALKDAYDALQAEFTKKCQMLSQLKSQTELVSDENQSSLQANETFTDNLLGEKSAIEEKDVKEQENDENFTEEGLQEFLAQFGEATGYEEEIKSRFPQVKAQTTNPYAVAWAEVLIKNLKEKNASSDPIINQYVLSDEKVRNKIIEDYLISLNKSQPPIVISSQSGERLSGVLPDSPKTLAEAKKRVEKMFS